jgi:UDP-N-acetyl-D-glucosamine/UDP-N-acetyl-D-galactosamine dehydrogenase
MYLIQAGNSVKTAKVIVLGLTFKENCPDLRNSKVADVVFELQRFGWDVSVHDPVAESDESVHEYGIPLAKWDDLPSADAIVAAVAHNEYMAMPLKDLLSKLKPGGVFMDVKSAYDPAAIQTAGYKLWRL